MRGLKILWWSLAAVGRICVSGILVLTGYIILVTPPYSGWFTAIAVAYFIWGLLVLRYGIGPWC